MRLPTQESIVAELQGIRKDYCTECECEDAPDFHDEECCAFVSVRLRVLENSWEVLSGDPSFDIDHNGCVGASTVGAFDDAEVLDQIAQQLLEEAEETIQLEGMGV